MIPAIVPAPPARRRRWRIAVAALGLVALAAGAFAAWLFHEHRVRDALYREALAETESLDPHWRLEEIEARRAPVPDEENAALVIRHVRSLLPRPRPGAPVDWDNFSRDVTPDVRLTDEQYTTVIDALEEVERAIRPALSLAHHPRGRHPISYTPDVISTLLPHADDIRQVELRVLTILPLADAHDGRGDAAEADCLALLNLGRSIGDEPFAISQLIRLRYLSQMVKALQRFFGQTEVPEPALARLQAALAAETEHDGWELAVRGERAMVYQSLEALQRGMLKPSLFRAFVGYPTNLPPPTALDRVRDWLDDQFGVNARPTQTWLLRESNRLQETARLPWPQRRAAVEAVMADRPEPPAFARFLRPNYANLMTGFQRHQALGRCTVAAVAAERYRLRHGTWPASLAALVPELMPAVPIDPYDGQPLRYRRLADGVVIYTLGKDGTDDGGKLDYQYQQNDGTDLGVRLWDVPHRALTPAGEP